MARPSRALGRSTGRRRKSPVRRKLESSCRCSIRGSRSSWRAAAQKRKAKTARAKAATRNLMKAARRRDANPGSTIWRRSSSARIPSPISGAATRPASAMAQNRSASNRSPYWLNPGNMSFGVEAIQFRRDAQCRDQSGCRVADRRRSVGPAAAADIGPIVRPACRLRNSVVGELTDQWECMNSPFAIARWCGW
jgi:hypothetical protein